MKQGGEDGTTTGEKILTSNAAKLRAICLNEENHPILFISDPKNGDRFEFGTVEELVNEAEAWEAEIEYGVEAAIESGVEAEENNEICIRIVDTHSLLSLIDFEAYKGDQPIVKL